MRLKLSLEEKHQRVDELLEILKLKHCQHTLVGNVMIKGVSGGERKRTSIGVELIANPRVIILDGNLIYYIYINKFFFTFLNNRSFISYYSIL